MEKRLGEGCYPTSLSPAALIAFFSHYKRQTRWDKYLSGLLVLMSHQKDWNRAVWKQVALFQDTPVLSDGLSMVNYETVVV